jgi:hypothetical protein
MQPSTIARMMLSNTEQRVGPAPFRQAQCPERVCGEPVEPVEGLLAGP